MRLSKKRFKIIISSQILNVFCISFGLKAQVNSAQGSALV
jgi:hypothetical protein